MAAIVKFFNTWGKRDLDKLQADGLVSEVIEIPGPAYDPEIPAWQATILAGRIIALEGRDWHAFDDYRHWTVAIYLDAKGEYREYSLGEGTYTAKVDAPAEEIAKYHAFKVAESERLQAERLAKQRRDDIEKRWAISRRAGGDRIEAGLKDRNEYLKLQKAFYGENFNHALKLLKQYQSAKLRSSFRVSMAEQILNWLRDPNPKFRTPLSAKQLEYLAPPRRW